MFSPDPAEVAFAKKILAAMPDGSGAVMIDGKMQDDATWKQAKVVVDLARLVAAKDPAMADILSVMRLVDCRITGAKGDQRPSGGTGTRCRNPRQSLIRHEHMK